MKFLTRHSIRQCATVCIICIICTLAVIINMQSGSSLDECVPQTCPQPPHSSNTPAVQLVGSTERPRDWRRTNQVVLEYNEDVAQRLKKLAEHQTPADHPDTIRLARDLLDPPPYNGDGIKHARYIMKTPQAKALMK